MKYLKNVKNKLDWEKYYNPEFNWNSREFYFNNNLSEEFIEEFYKKINWQYLSYFYSPSENLMNNFLYFWNWTYVLQHVKVSEFLLRNVIDKIIIDKNCWKVISQHQTLSEDFIREFKDKLDWGEICRNQKLSEDFIKEFKNKITIYEICRYQKLSKEFIEELLHNISEYSVSAKSTAILIQAILKFQKLSDDFIKRNVGIFFRDNIYDIFRYQKLSEDTINLVINSYNMFNAEWSILAQKQNLSEEFLIKYRKNIGWENILCFQKISKETVNKYLNEIPENYRKLKK